VQNRDRIRLRAVSCGSRFELVTTTPEACPICGGTGWQTVERGKEREVVRCECRVKDRGERLLAAAHIPPRYQHCELANFQCDPDDKAYKSIAAARLLAGRFVEEYPLQKEGLLFVGEAGVGKTHLAIGIIKELIREKGIRCLFCDYRELIKSIQDSYNPSVQTTEMELLRPVLDAEVLVLDDLAAVRSSEWIFDIVNYILNSRYNRDTTTIITTNFPDKPEQSHVEFDNLRSKAVAERVARGDTLGDRIGQRMWSRLREMCKKVEMAGPDFRQHSKRAEFRSLQAPTRLTLRNTRRNG
jgi:DNA replication protein DnaC